MSLRNVVLALAAVAGSLSGCGDAPPSADPVGISATGTSAPGIPPAKDAFPAGMALTAAPGGAKDVKAAKEGAKEGDDIVVRGRIGTLEPFVSGLAVMTLVDPALVPCSEMQMEDGCKTPWDYCCTAAEEIKANEATIQVVGADGRPLRHDLRLEGHAPLSWVVVTGKVGPRPDPKVLVVNATGIFVEKVVPASK